VGIQHGQRLATSPELNSTSREVTNWVKLEGWMYQAVTRVNVLSPVMSLIVEVDALDSTAATEKASMQRLYRGLRQWHDTRW